MKLWVTVLDENKNVIGDGPIFRLQRWTQRRRMDRAGEFEAHLTADDPRAVELIDHLHILKAYTSLQYPLTVHSQVLLFGAGIVHETQILTASEGHIDFVVRGPDSLYDLVRFNTGQLNLEASDPDPHETIMGAASGWTVSTGGFGNGVKLSFNYSNLLEALINLANVNGDHFIWDEDDPFDLVWYQQTDTFGLVVPSSLKTIVASRTPQALQRDLNTSPGDPYINTIQASQVEQIEQSYDLITRLYAFGGGVGTNRLSVQYGTEWPDGTNLSSDYIDDAGDTYRWDGGLYIRNVTAEGSYGNRYGHTQWPQIVPRTVGASPTTDAANTLVKFAVNYLRYLSRPRRYYRVQLAHHEDRIAPLYTINLRYYNAANGQLLQSFEEDDLYIIETVEELTPEGIRTTEIVTGTVDAPLKSDAEQLAESARTAQIARTHDQFLGQDLGTASEKLDTIYAATINADTVTGEVMDGAEWEYTGGDMTIDANSASDRVLYIVNQGAGDVDLNVSRNIIVGGTVDGVDLQSHVGDQAAHHDPVSVSGGLTLTGQDLSVDSSVVRTTRTLTAGNGLSGGGDLSANRTFTLNLASPSGLEISADALRVADTIAGAGLGISSKVLSVNVGNGLEIATDTVQIDLAATSGLTFSGGDLAVGAGDGIDVGANSIAVDVTDILGDGLGESSNNIVLGTPSTLGVSTSNNVTTSSHTHAITTSSNPGAAARILASTAGGGLTLESFQSDGDITALQSFYAGASGFRVLHHTHDGDHVHVVINPTGGWSLDEQFGLDIDDNLLVRGWIVGKHAIQLEGATAIGHFDGNLPFETNYSGEATLSNGQAATINDSTPFVEGRFGKAVQIASALTNYLTNPSFEVDTTGWTQSGSTISTSSVYAKYGVNSLKIVTDSSSFGGVISPSTSYGATESWTASCWIWRTETAADMKISIRQGTTEITSAAIPKQTGWQFVSVSGTTSGSGSDLRFYVQKDGDASVITYYIDGCQLAQGAVARPYIDGSLGNGFSWSGTAHLSTSSQSENGALYYQDDTLLDTVSGAVMFWFRVPWGERAVYQGGTYFFDTGASSGELRMRKLDSSTTLRVGIGGDDDAIQYASFTWDNEWHHIVITWDTDDNSSELYIDGTSVATGVAPSFAPTSLYIGSRNDNTFPLQGWLDDFVIVDRIPDADEIRAVYDSEAPVFAETSTFHWRAGRNRFWADIEGLWMYNASGTAMFGAYAGDESGGGTKSWAGVALAESDLIIGNANRNGYLLWDDSEGTLHVEGNIVITGGSGLANLTDADLDNIGDGATYARVLATALSSGSVLLGQASGDLDDIGDGSTYARVLATGLSAGSVLLDQASGDIDDIADGATYGKVQLTALNGSGLVTVDALIDGTYARIKASALNASGLVLLDQTVNGTYGKVLATDISAGHIVLSSVSGDLDDVDDGTTYGKVRTTQIADGVIQLSAVDGDLDDVGEGTTYGKVKKTLLSAGFIQVGAGTKDSNLNGWYIDNSEIVGQLGGTDQVVMGTDGRIIAGAGDLWIDDDGIAVYQSTSGQSDTNAYTFRESGHGTIGGLYMDTDATITRMRLENVADTNKFAYTLLETESGASYDAYFKASIKRGTGDETYIEMWDPTAGVGFPALKLLSSFLYFDGLVAQDLTFDEGIKITIDEIRAKDSEGLTLADDGGNVGVFIKDGGNMGAGGNTNPTTGLVVSKGMQVQGAASPTYPTAGAGLEIVYDSDATWGDATGASHLQSYDRGAAAYKTMRLNAYDFVFALSGTITHCMKSTGELGVGTASPSGSKLDVNDDSIRVRNSKTPASASATGVKGELAWDTNYLYVCINTNTWRRVAHSSW